jgi:hypothetical protein
LNEVKENLIKDGDKVSKIKYLINKRKEFLEAKEAFQADV